MSNTTGDNAPADSIEINHLVDPQHFPAIIRLGQDRVLHYRSIRGDRAWNTVLGNVLATIERLPSKDSDILSHTDLKGTTETFTSGQVRGSMESGLQDYRDAISFFDEARIERVGPDFEVDDLPIQFEHCGFDDFEIFQAEAWLVCSILANSRSTPRGLRTPLGLQRLLTLCRMLIEQGTKPYDMEIITALSILLEPFYRLVALSRYMRVHGRTWESDNIHTWDWAKIKDQIEASKLLPVLTELDASAPDTHKGKKDISKLLGELRFGQTMGQLQGNLPADLPSLSQQEKLSEHDAAIVLFHKYLVL